MGGFQGAQFLNLAIARQFAEAITNVDSRWNLLLEQVTLMRQYYRHPCSNALPLLKRYLTDPHTRYVRYSIQRTGGHYPKPDTIVAGAFDGLGKHHTP